MLQLRLHVICLIAISALTTSQLYAQTAKAEQDKLLGYEQQLKQQQAELTQYKSQLSDAKSELAAAGSSAGPEKTELDDAARDLADAKANFDADPSDDNKSRLKNAEFKHALAERKYKKANSEQVELQDKVDKLAAQVTAATASVGKLNTSIAQQKSVLEQARAREVAASKSRELEEQRRKTEAAQAELARVKAQLEQKQREEEARKAAELAAAEKAAAAKAAAKAAAPTTPVTVAAPAAAAPSAAVKVASEPAKPKPAASSEPAGTGIALLTTKQQVSDEQQRLNTLLATPDKNKSAYNKILNVKTVSANGETGPAKANTLSALGHNQYRGSAELDAGDVMMIVGFNRWRQSIPNGGKYEVVLDLSDAKNPRLVYYPESLVTP